MLAVTADFPAWFRAGCYGGLACSLIAAAGVAGYALARRRGTPRQLAGAMFGCLAAAVCILPAIIWSQTRLDLQGPALSVSEVLLWLAWVAVIGWMLPLGTSAGFLLLAAPFDARARQHAGGTGPRSLSARTSEEESKHEPLGPGVAWGWLIHLDGSYISQQVALSRQVILLGRERDNDILLEAELASRYHAELHLEHGRAYLKDCGSMNGTSVNGQRVWGLAPLQHGDVLDIGGQRFRYEDALALPGSPAKALLSAPRSEAPHLAETAALPALAAPPGRGAPAVPGRLIVSGGPNAGSTFEVQGSLVTIGRDSGCEVVIPDSSISRRHAQLVRQESGLYVHDLGSRNGTAVNGQRLSAPHRLADGDTLTVGNIPLRYVVEQPASVAEAQETEPLTLPATPEEQRAPGTPLRKREQPAPLRLPSRKLAPAADDAPLPSEATAEPAVEPEQRASIQVSNNVFRPHRLIASKVFTAPRQLPPAEP